MDGRTLVIGDIHGGYKALLQVLERTNPKPSDSLIFLGDYVDGWSGSAKVISKLMALGQAHCCIFIRGNHDALFQEWLETHKTNPLWLANGGASTIAAYESLDKKTLEVHHLFLRNLRNRHIDAKNRLFLHAGFTNIHGPNREYHDDVFYWDRTLWETAIATDKILEPADARYPKRFTHFREMFIGHTPTLHIGKTMPTKALNLWNLDTGAGFTGRLSAMDVDSKEVFQSDPVQTLYRGEKGRNR